MKTMRFAFQSEWPTTFTSAVTTFTKIVSVVVVVVVVAVVGGCAGSLILNVEVIIGVEDSILSLLIAPCLAAVSLIIKDVLSQVRCSLQTWSMTC